MHSVLLKNDAVGDLVHSLKAINNITSSSKKVTIFLSKLSEKYSFLVKDPKVEIKILNYNLSLIEKVKLIFFLTSNNIKNVYILAPKNFYYYLAVIFRNIKFYAICIDNINNYKRPNLFLRRFLYKYEINDRGKIFRRESTESIQNKLTMHDNKNSDYQFNVNIKKSEILNNILPDKYIFFHFKKERFDDMGWKFNQLQLMFIEFTKYSKNIIITKDIENDKNNLIFKENFNSYDFNSKKFIDNKKNVLFLDNIVGEDLFNVIKYSHKVVAHHGMMTSLGYLLKKPVLDLFHCKIKKWEDYRRYRNSFYEFKPKYYGYDFIIPNKNIRKTIRKMKFSLQRHM